MLFKILKKVMKLKSVLKEDLNRGILKKFIKMIKLFPLIVMIKVRKVQKNLQLMKQKGKMNRTN